MSACLLHLFILKLDNYEPELVKEVLFYLDHPIRLTSYQFDNNFIYFFKVMKEQNINYHRAIPLDFGCRKHIPKKHILDIFSKRDCAITLKNT